MNRMLEPLALKVVAAATCLVLSSCADQPTAPSASTAAPLPAPTAAAASFAPARGAAQAPAASAVDPGVIQALERMGAYLRTLKNFEVTLNSTTDAALDNDQLAQVSKTARLKVRRPDGARADFADDSGDRKVLYYNGKTATVYDPETKFYATVPAPATLKEVVAQLHDRYGIEFPAADLFSWSGDKMDTSAIRSADFLGVARVDGKMTDHFALRQEGVDWQIWIEHGSAPLPRKLVITTTSDVARPQHAVNMRWNLSPRFAADTFAFKAPAGSQRIVIRRVDGTVEAPGK
ncbi:MAG: DUF2092 domain-containing protein [Variovorax sp.]|nr:MAG: DUF2092 domain-containing protein [Variovorax sp.]